MPPRIHCYTPLQKGVSVGGGVGGVAGVRKLRAFARGRDREGDACRRTSTVVCSGKPQQIVPHALCLERCRHAAHHGVHVRHHGGVEAAARVCYEIEAGEVRGGHLKGAVHAVRRPAEEKRRGGVVRGDNREHFGEENVIHVGAPGLEGLVAGPRLIQRARAALVGGVVLPQVHDGVLPARVVARVRPVCVCFVGGTR